jgi:hypothetical protein
MREQWQAGTDTCEYFVQFIEGTAGGYTAGCGAELFLFGSGCFGGGRFSFGEEIGRDASHR